VELRQLGQTEIRVSLLGLGTVKLGRSEHLKYPHAFEIPDDTDARRLLDRARDLGINLIDTAPAYGTSEARLGELLTGSRRNWVLCTKVGEEFENGGSRYDFSPEHVQRSVKRSLSRLRTDYLDVVLIHSDGHDVAILQQEGTLQALQDLQAKGCIRAVGISHKTPAGARLAISMGCDVIMATLSIAETTEAALIAEAGAQKCGVLVKKALASGHSSTRSLKYVAAQPGVSSIVVGTINPEHLKENAQVVSGG